MPDQEPIDIAAGADSVDLPEPSPSSTEPSRERAPMLDVHTPHPTHTWKDFFIHIATITVGLLIAISLEQTVEYFHHLQQRHQLEEHLHAEAEKNLPIHSVTVGRLSSADCSAGYPPGRSKCEAAGEAVIATAIPSLRP